MHKQSFKLYMIFIFTIKLELDVRGYVQLVKLQFISAMNAS